MIKLTYYQGEAVYIAPERIDAVYAEIGATTINCGCGESYSVEESPEEVVRKIMDYKLAISRYEAASKASASSNYVDIIAMSDYAEGDLKKLAGL